MARLLFPPKDDHTLKFLYDDNQRVEPEWYIPIIPMVLINGAEGIGTGWSCKIPNFDIREVVNNIRRLMDGEEPLPMVTILCKSGSLIFLWLQFSRLYSQRTYIKLIVLMFIRFILMFIRFIV